MQLAVFVKSRRIYTPEGHELQRVRSVWLWIILGEKKMKTSWRTNWQNLAATTIHQFYMVTASFCPRIRSFTDYVFLPWKEFVYLRGPQAVRLIDVSLIIEVLCKISFVSFVYYYYLPENAAYSPSQRSCFRRIERQLKVHREGSIRGKFECFVSKT